MKELIFEALFDFNFRNMDSGLMEFVNKGDRYKLLKIDDYEQNVIVKRIRDETKLKISIYHFVSRFGEVVNK